MNRIDECSRLELESSHERLVAACKSIDDLLDLAIGGVIEPRKLIPAMLYCRAAIKLAPTAAALQRADDAQTAGQA